jgi:hypothetical protein
VDDKFNEWLERADLYSSVVEQFSEPDPHHQLYCDSGCGPQKDGNRTGRPGFGNSRIDYPWDGDRAGGHTSCPNHDVLTVVPEFSAAQCAVSIDAGEHGIQEHL